MNNEQLNAEKRKMRSIWDTVSSALLILGLIGSPFSGFFLGMRIYTNSLLLFRCIGKIEGKTLWIRKNRSVIYLVK